MAREPWDKRDEESPEAFEAFIAYRDGDETTASVAQRLRKSKTMVQRWSRQHAWQERRDAWLAAKDQTATRTRLKVIGETEEERQRDLMQMNGRHAATAMRLISKINQRLEKLDLSKLTPTAIAHWLDVAVKVERLARGAATVAVAGADGGAIQVDIREAAEQRIAGIIGGVLANDEAGPLVGKPN